MKVKFTIPLLLFASLAIFSCSKEDDPTKETENPPGESLFTKMTQGLPADDTVYVVSYDADKRIKSIINSSWEDSLDATYNSAGNLSSFIIRSGSITTENTYLSYNANNQLTQIDFQAHKYREKYVFEYTNGVISKQSFYSNSAFDGGEPQLSRYYTYTVTDGNITSMKEYTYQDTLAAETIFTYNNEANVFKPISLLNRGNRLGADQIANLETFFNKNLLVSSSTSHRLGSYTAAFTYTYNDNKQLTKAVVSSTTGGYIFTWQFSY